MISKQPNEEREEVFPTEAERGRQLDDTAIDDAYAGEQGEYPARQSVPPSRQSDGELKPQLAAVRPMPQGSDADALAGTLLASGERETMRVRWSGIQESFVDDPKRAVENADQLVGEAIQRLAEIFQDTRHRLEEDWGTGDESISTEKLRQALKRYRTFFDQILAV